MEVPLRCTDVQLNAAHSYILPSAIPPLDWSKLRREWQWLYQSYAVLEPEHWSLPTNCGFWTYLDSDEVYTRAEVHLQSKQACAPEKLLETLIGAISVKRWIRG